MYSSNFRVFKFRGTEENAGNFAVQVRLTQHYQTAPKRSRLCRLFLACFRWRCSVPFNWRFSLSISSCIEIPRDYVTLSSYNRLLFIFRGLSVQRSVHLSPVNERQLFSTLHVYGS